MDQARAREHVRTFQQCLTQRIVLNENAGEQVAERPGFAAFLLALDAITLLLGRPVVPEVMAQAYSSADPRWLFWIALVVAAPLFEEVFFRGFVYRGLAGSPLGPVGAIVLTAALWAGIHMQYDAYGMFSIFGMGLVLGWARWRANSVILTCLLHAFANIYATVETAFVV